MTPPLYPGVSDRVKAAVADSFVIVGFMVGISYLFSFFETVPDNARVIAFIFVFLLYDPIFTSLFGGTIGHTLNGIRVSKANNEEKNILFPLAIVRFLVKSLLGLISLFTVNSNEKKKAIHDHIVGSVVIFKKQPKSIKN